MLPLVTILLQDTRPSSDYHLTYPKPCAHASLDSAELVICREGEGRGGEGGRRRGGEEKGKGEGERELLKLT